MRIAIVDDERPEQSRLQELLRQAGDWLGLTLRCWLFDSGEAFLASAQDFDLVFLDVYMEGIDGVEPPRRFRERPGAPLLVFLTGSAQHYAAAFAVHAFDYLEKPAAPERVCSLLADAVQLLGAREPCFVLTGESSAVSIPYRKLRYVMSDSNYLVFSADQEYRARMTFGEAARSLGGDGRFLTINRGVIVNLDRVTAMEGYSCVLDDGTTLPLNQRHARSLRQSFVNYQFSRRRQAVTGLGETT